MKLHPVSDERVSRLRTLLDGGRFAIPRLQRAFVWNGPKAAKLLDSVYRGMPIGSLTIWDTSGKNRDLLRKDARVLPPFREHNPRVWFVLDGQQRLSVLYRAQEGGVVQNGRHQAVDFGRLVFRVTDGNGDDDRFAYRKPVPREWVAVPDVLASNWKLRLGDLTVGQLNRAQRCRERLLAYRVPIVRVEADSIGLARELFIRINSAGTPIAAADRAFARAAEFDLREHAEQAWSQLPEAFRGLTHEAMLQSRALLDGLDAVAAEAMERVATLWDERIQADRRAVARFSKEWAGQQKAMHRALDLLRAKFFVLDDGLLPSQYMVSTLTVFFAHRPKQPTPAQLAELRIWFWATALGQRYSGSGYRQNILDDSRFFKALAEGRPTKFHMAERIDPDELRRAAYGRRSSVADAFFCLLISQKPQYLSNGSDMQVSDFASAANRRHKHHVFPRHHLRQQPGLSQRAINSVLNLCLIAAEENSQFGSKPPRKYLEPFAGSPHFKRVMSRHLLPAGDEHGLWDLNPAKGYLRFLKAREALVCAEFERAAGTKLFRRKVT
jgi:hypothetical protein